MGRAKNDMLLNKVQWCWREVEEFKGCSPSLAEVRCLVALSLKLRPNVNMVLLDLLLSFFTDPSLSRPSSPGPQDPRISGYQGLLLHLLPP
jgi:hypothetical protein